MSSYLTIIFTISAIVVCYAHITQNILQCDLMTNRGSQAFPLQKTVKEKKILRLSIHILKQ